MKAIKTTYKGATNTKGSRIIASDEDTNKITIPYPHELSGMDCHAKAAVALCLKMGWTGTLHGGGLKNCYVFVFAPLSDDRNGAYPIEEEVKQCA